MAVKQDHGGSARIHENLRDEKTQELQGRSVIGLGAGSIPDFYRGRKRRCAVEQLRPLRVTRCEGAEHCYYHGQLRGVKRSWAALSTCHGLRGLFSDGTFSYGMEPVLSGSQQGPYDHSETDGSSETDVLSRETGENPVAIETLQRSKRQVKRGQRTVQTETKYIELMVVNDHDLFVQLRRSVSQTRNFAKAVVNMADAIFKEQLNTRIVLVAMETWSSHNMVSMGDDPLVTLRDFMKYRKESIRERSDAVHLFSGRTFLNSRSGTAYIGGICSLTRGGGVNEYGNVGPMAITLCQSLGQNIGMMWNKQRPAAGNCRCPDPWLGCIMEDTGYYLPRKFSRCSIDEYMRFLQEGGGSCLFNKPSKYSFHRSTTSRVEVSSAPSPPYTVLTMHCFPLLRRRMVVQNLFEAVRKSFSMASPNSSHVRVFASVTASCTPLGLPVPACCLRSPTGQKGPIGLLQFDGIPHRRSGSGIAATAGTDHLAATALVGRLNNGGAEHGPLGLNVPRLPRYMVKALPEVGVEALSDRRLCQTFPADPHNTFGSARSDRHSPPPSQPTHHQVLLDPPECGNGFVEVGEECDCGSYLECSRSGGACCKKCTLTHDAMCSNGLCCRDCRYELRGSTCREAVSDCDVPETCTGDSSQCPHNVHKLDGYTCETGQGRCYGGRCKTRDGQCRTLWGYNSADRFCYEKFNVEGSDKGNCGRNPSGHGWLPCQKQDVLCGFLMCTNLTSRPRFGEQQGEPTSLTVYHQNQYLDCRGGHAVLEDGSDLGYVEDGTPCGPNMICLYRHCLAVNTFNLTMCPGSSSSRICSHHGTCSNEVKCICDVDYTGTDCSVFDPVLQPTPMEGPEKYKGTPTALPAFRGGCFQPAPYVDVEDD
ncbi:Disintegrin and metalloproteinase domain-containing protein 11 [Merluccius polli]|uniref:Disintegrin and metalloproteinase domain-containing protein 11 n=1 Tax=Merluccius polli TaxID=89951 RepID=A0AA47PE45_MERPO|nr:Disintegrin and metalloproteinase domain-containing protein 11 [Merluccius polli]